ncbi:MAG: UvrD-helicase domain-containing protein [Oscillospiraceae bacterium]|jgi:DNA helicase-2/ATP-dependent DNA helicase PcrA|nr:UvrD-helicase domain-containing protein [Oscillospiraceae bacterium]
MPQSPEFITAFAAARRAAIAVDFAHLNPEQREATLTTEGPLLILAGAGSGKTTVLINRIGNLIRYGRGSDCGDVPDFVDVDDLRFLEDYAANPTADARGRVRELCAVEPCEPWRVIAITFTNKAAGELKSRLEDMLGSTAREVWAMTFHSACVRILRRDIEKMGYGRDFIIYDSADSQSVMKRVMREVGIDEKQVTAKSVLGAISRAKDTGMLAADFADEANKGYDTMKKIIARCYIEYEKRLRDANALDFDDLILTAVRLLERDAECREYYQNRFRYVLVDEYQDTNSLQYKLASLIAGGRRNICVVGDDDQSIYKFRGATVENILGFERQYAGAEVVRLERNYRSTSPILQASNDVIQHNQSRHRKRLWTDRDAGDLPKLVTREDERDEARFVADTIIGGVADGGHWSDHVVLYRMNAQSNTFEYEFKRNNIPYKIYGGTGFFERAEVKDAMAYLCTVANPYDEAHLLRIVNTPTRGIGNTTLDVLGEMSMRTGEPLFELMRNAREHEELQKAADRLIRFVEMIDILRLVANAKPLDEFYDAMIEATGLIRALELKQTDENIARIENIRELKTNILNFMRENPNGNLAEFLTEIALYTDLDRDEDDPNHVAVMTMHSAKGLEFDTVFIVGAEDGIFPGTRAIGEPEEMEEERRLCYVAMTRAKRRLFFVNARRRMLFGRTEAHRTSCFVEEIDQTHLDRPTLPKFAGFDHFDADPETRGFAKPQYERRDTDFSRSVQIPQRKSASASRAKSAPITPSAPTVTFAVGDTVEHRAFGRGVIAAVTKTGGDALLDVDFDTAGRKRLMQKSASAYMTTINN